MESKCRAQQKQHQLALFHPKVEIIPKTEGESHSLQDTLNVEKAKVASLEYTVTELQDKNRDLDALLSERDSALSELLRQLHGNGAEPQIDPPTLPSFSSPLGTRPVLNHDKIREIASQFSAPTPPPVLFPCHAPTNGEVQEKEARDELNLKGTRPFQLI
jgi:hypothetical protein